MNDTVLRVGMFVILFLFGIAVRKLKILSDKTPEKILEIIFHFCLPITLFWAITSTKLNFDLIVLPLSAMIIASITGLFSFIIGKLINLKPKQLGVLLVSTMIMNTSFTMPFFGALYGDNGIKIFSVFDFGNLLLVFTLIYFIALYFGHVKDGNKLILKKLVSSPPLWIIVFSIVLTSNNFILPTSISNILSNFNYIVYMIVMFTLGMLFKPDLDHLKLIAWGLGLRMVLGVVLGIAVSRFFGLQGVERLAVIVGASSPNGYTTIIYASIAKLDKHYAASLVSASLVFGVVLVPLLLYYLK